MAPKPFPLPISVGSDICRMSRFGAMLRQHGLFNHFARRTFNRLEWPALLNRIAHTNARELPCNRDYALQMDKKQPILHLPVISDSSQTLVGTERTPEGKVVRYLAGRWAAKEATIKAHRNRRLFMTDISIIKSQNKKPLLLVDPPRRYVLMNEEVTKSRGLQGLSTEFGSAIKMQSRHGTGIMPTLSAQYYGDIVDGEFLESKDRNATTFFRRRAKVAMEDRQVAELSISHDGEYAMAVCIASDDSTLDPEEKPFIIDDGSGDPIHEPEWADEGWFDPTTGIQDDGTGQREIDQ